MMMAHPAHRQKKIYYRLFETLVICLLASFFFMAILGGELSRATQAPGCIDQWLACYIMEHQITRTLGMRPGGIWYLGYFFPFENSALLFNEPTWGVSWMLLPFWLMKQNIFLLYCLGGIGSIILVWLGIYWFAKSMRCKRLHAFLAAMVFCLSGVSLNVIDHTAFWAFFFIPLLGIVINKIMESQKGGVFWSVLFGLGYGYLGWSSAHLACMGGFFLLVFSLWRLWQKGFERKRLFFLLLAFSLAAILAGLVYVPMFIIHQQFQRPSNFGDQVHYATNWINIIYFQGERPLNPLPRFPFWQKLDGLCKGEVSFGISLTLILLSLYAFLSLLRRPDKAGGKRKFCLRTAIYYLCPLLFGLTNVFFFKKMVVGPEVNIPMTLSYYVLFGMPLVFFRDRFTNAFRRPSFLFFFLAAFSLLLAFGPCYVNGHNKCVVSPVFLLLQGVPGFSGIRAVARWGIMFSFCLSLAVFIFLSKQKYNGVGKLIMGIFFLILFIELFLGLPPVGLPGFDFYNWNPRKVDFFLKNLPGKGAIFELSGYPVDLSSGGERLYAVLFHGRPTVTGCATFHPQVTLDYVYAREGRLTARRIDDLRKFGARYWVFHMDQWPKEDNFNPGEEFYGLKRIASLDDGKTLVYEDPEPKIAVTPFGLMPHD